MIVQPMTISGGEAWPLVEGGKGVAVTNGHSSGAWARAGGVGTISGVNADVVDDNGEYVPLVYEGRNRVERHEELVRYSIRGAICQARIADETRNGNGRIHLNVLWEMGSCERVLTGVLEGAKGLIHGVTCGAGMPYRLSEICAHYGIHYYPIISSARAFRALWKRAYHKFSDLLGAVVYEDPWLAGGHNGLSNSENPKEPQSPFPRVKELRDMMRSLGLGDVPIVMAGGVWHLQDWKDWINNKELGPIVFQFGTRPLLTQESPISEGWKSRLAQFIKGDVLLHRFSPTGFYSSAIRNLFLDELVERSERQITFGEKIDRDAGRTVFYAMGGGGRGVFVTSDDMACIQQWHGCGYDQPLRTPDNTLIFVKRSKAREIKRDQADCMGCLSHCKFSNWKDHDARTTGKLPDPRSFCIQKTLQNIAHNIGDPDDQLMFAGHGVYRFKEDPFYANGFVPTVKELVQRILTGR